MTEPRQASADPRGEDTQHASRLESSLDTSQAHIARVYYYWLGGKDNFAADRAAGDAVIQAYPGVIATVRANRALLARMVRYLAGEAGIVQFLDMGTGIPSANNTHEVAQSVTPSARVVYVDNDPIVLVHARALLVSNPLGATSYLEADIRDPEPILDRAAHLLDFFSSRLTLHRLFAHHVVANGDMTHEPADVNADFALQVVQVFAVTMPAPFDSLFQGKAGYRLDAHEALVQGVFIAVFYRR